MTTAWTKRAAEGYMKRRELFTAAAAVALAPALPARAVEDKNTRLVFKLVTLAAPELPSRIYRLGDENWQPTPEEITAISDAMKAAEVDDNFIVVNGGVSLTLAPPAVVMVKVDFGDLKRGDTFVMYEGKDWEGGKTGERVSGVWLCSGEPYMDEGVWVVFGEEVKDVVYQIPDRSPV